MRPGPEFVLRRYFFNSDSTFELQQFYYRDSHCTDPAYSIEARGRIAVKSQSWLVPGGTEADYELSLVTIRPYTSLVARKLHRNFLRTCPDLVHEQWRPNEAYIVYQLSRARARRSLTSFDGPERDIDDDDVSYEYDDVYESNYDAEDYADDDDDVIIDHDCRATLFIVFHELQLVRVERQHRHDRRTLWLGDIHSDYTKRESYRPTSYQDELVSAQVRGLELHLCFLFNCPDLNSFRISEDLASFSALQLFLDCLLPLQPFPLNLT